MLLRLACAVFVVGTATASASDADMAAKDLDPSTPCAFCDDPIPPCDVCDDDTVRMQFSFAPAPRRALFG